MNREDIIAIIWLVIVCLVIFFAIVVKQDQDKELKKRKYEIEKVKDELNEVKNSLYQMITAQARALQLLNENKDIMSLLTKVQELYRLEEIVKNDWHIHWASNDFYFRQYQKNKYKEQIQEIQKEIEELLKVN